MQAAWLDHRGVVSATGADLQASLDALEKGGPVFIEGLRQAGWQVDQVTIRTGEVRFKRHKYNECSSAS